MDLTIGDRVFYTRSNGLRPPATVVGTVEDGLLHLEYYQDGLRVVNRQCKMESISFAIPSLDSPPDSARPHTHTIAAHMGQGAPKDMLVMFVIGADDGQCPKKKSIVTIIVGIKRLRKVVHCSETGGLPTWKNFWLLQPVSNHPRKRQPNSFNCWIPLSWCVNLLRSFPYFHDPCIWPFVQFAALKFITAFGCSPDIFWLVLVKGTATKTPLSQ